MLFFLYSLGLAKIPCKNAGDCSLGGQCIDGKCICWPTWTGVNCSILSLQPTQRVGAWYRPGVESSWGGSVIQDGNKYHMFAADMEKKCGLNSWQHNSRIVHLVSGTPEGPYKQKDIVFGAFSHNPTVHKAPDGTFVLFHIGNGQGGSRPPITDCTNGTTPKQYSYPENDISGTRSTSDTVAPSILYSKSVNGPWVVLNNSHTGDSCNNPGAYIFPNGTTLLVCKVSIKPPIGQGIRQMQISVAPHWSGPYTKTSLTSVYGEDAFIFRQPQDKNFHMILHAMHPHKVPTTAWSENGLDWTPAFLADLNCTTGMTYPSFGHIIPMINGTTFESARRERHQILIGADGTPTHLFNGVTTRISELHDFSFTSVQPIKN